MATEADQAGKPDAVEPEVPTRRWVLIFGVYLMILNLLLFYVLFRFWPGQVPIVADPLRVRLIPRLWEPCVWPEVRLLVLVAVAGALGSYIHLATSFADYLGNRQFVSS
jgi:hypothetical protein